MTRNHVLSALALLVAMTAAQVSLATEPPRSRALKDSQDAPLPAMPPGLGLPHFEHDPDLLPYQDYLGTIAANDSTYLRPLAVVQAEQDVPFTFIADEVMITPSSQAELERFLEENGGIVLQEPGLPDPPPESDIDPAEVEPDPAYLVRILDTPEADLTMMDEIAAELGLTGEIRVSSEEAMGLLSLVLRESSSGVDVSLNSVMRPQQSFPPLALEEEPMGSSFENPLGQGALYPETVDTGNQQTRANRAWQWMAFSTRQLSVYVAVIDGGFCIDSLGKVGTDQSGRTCIDIPNGYYQYDFVDDDYIAEGDNPNSCSGGSGCPDHGATVMSAALAVRNNRYGTAGIGSPVARAMLFKVSGSRFESARAIRTAAKWQAGVANMSFGSDVGWLEVAFGGISGWSKTVDALKVANSWDMLTVAAAGNDNMNLKSAHYVPCMLKYTDLCVGALAFNSLNRASYSNYGWNGTSPGIGGVDLFAPGTVRVGPTAHNTSNRNASGTSLASPFVAGAAALTRAVNPTASRTQIKQIITSTLRAPVSTETSPGSIDVLRAVQKAGEPLVDHLGGTNTSPSSSALVTDSGISNLTVRPGVTEYFEYQATEYLDSATLAARYVSQLGQLSVGATSSGGASSTGRIPGTSTTDDFVTSTSMCVGESFDFLVRGATAAVGNAFNLVMRSKVTSTSLTADANEPNDVYTNPTLITAPRITNTETMTAFPKPDCRTGLTLHSLTDVDYYRTTVNVWDLDTYYTGLGVEVSADFPITVSLSRGGTTLKSDTGRFVYLEIQNAQPGEYLLKVSGSSLNAYTMRTRVVPPGWNVRLWELEQWLKNQLLVHPGPVPGDGPPVLPWMAAFPWDPATELAMWGAGVIPVVESTERNTFFGGTPIVMAVGAGESGALYLGLGPLVGETSPDDPDAIEGLHAVLLSADGEALWSVESEHEATDTLVESEPGRTMILVINGPVGTETDVMIDMLGF